MLQIVQTGRIEVLNLTLAPAQDWNGCYFWFTFLFSLTLSGKGEVGEKSCPCKPFPSMLKSFSVSWVPNGSGFHLC